MQVSTSLDESACPETPKYLEVECVCVEVEEDGRQKI